MSHRYRAPFPTTLSAGPIIRFDGLAADAPPRSIRSKIPAIFNPFLRLLLFLVLFAVCLALTWLAFTVLIGPTGVNPMVVGTAIQLIGSIIAYAIWTLLIERRRPPVELAPRRAFGLVWGLLFGALAIGVSFGVIWLLGGFRIEGAAWPANVGDWWRMVFVVGVGAGISEELLFRGVLFRITEEIFGTWLAIVLSGLTFGAVHLGNPDATLWGAIAIGLEAGLLFGVLYAWSRSLWLLIGFHFAWNVVQGPVLGITVSGTGAQEGLLRVTPEGSPLISGGIFGAEASVVTVVLLTTVAVLLAVRLARTGGVVAPMWIRRARQHRALAAESPHPALP